MSLPSFTDKEYWEEQLQTYAENGARSMHDNGGVWDYFKDKQAQFIAEGGYSGTQIGRAHV